MQFKANLFKIRFEKMTMSRVLHFDGQNLFLNEHEKPIWILKTNKKRKELAFRNLFFWYVSGSLLRVLRHKITY